jgi:hypothetical protein
MRVTGFLDGFGLWIVQLEDHFKSLALFSHEGVCICNDFCTATRKRPKAVGMVECNTQRPRASERLQAMQDLALTNAS